LREQLQKADDYGKKRLEYINKAAPDGGTNARAESMAGRIESTRADQADKLVGVFSAVQINGIRTNTLLAAGNDWMGRTYSLLTDNLSGIQANTLRTANNTDRLAAIETAMVSINKKMDNPNNALGGTGRPVI